MNSTLRQKLPLIILLPAAAIFTFIFYGNILVNPNGYLFSNSGDGIKNYYTYAWHISRDSCAFDFEGMNYPYGENFMYTDCHPIAANFLRFVSGIFPNIETYSIGILNFMMILSVFLTFVAGYYLILEFIKSKWLTVIFAVSMAVLAPQIFRMGGHYALSYSPAIPFSWWLLIRLIKTGHQVKYGILLLLNNIFWLFIHAYLGIIILSFLILITVLVFFTERQKVLRIRKYLTAFAAIIVPVLVYYFFIRITDIHEGRTDNPSGFFLYNAEFDDIFVPHHPPLRPLLDRLTGNAISLQWEAWSYVGIAATLTIMVILVLLISGLIKGRLKRVSKNYLPDRLMNLSLLAAFIVLLFAMAFPFRQFPVMAEVIPFVKQFRATGRFAWPFYFAVMVFVATIMQLLMQKYAAKKWIFILPVLFLGLNLAEGIPYHRDMSSRISASENIFEYKNLPETFKKAIENTDPSAYQAIITLPFYYYGSESFARPRNDAAVRASLVFSYHTGIPNVCANLTRTSVPESKKIVELVSPGFYPKPIRADMPDQRPFLVLVTNSALTHYEQKLLDRTELLGYFGELSLYTLAFDDLFKNTSPEYFSLFDDLKDTLFGRQGFLVSDSGAFLYYDNFDDIAARQVFRGSGAYHGYKKGKNTFAEFGPGTFRKDKTYHFSMWMYNGAKDALNLWFRFIVEEWDPAADQWHETTFFPEQSEVIFGDWSLVEGDFKIESTDSFVYLVTKGKPDSKAPLFADDLLITEKGNDVFRLDSDTLFYNNHKIIPQP